MFTQAELIDAIEQINNSKHTIQNCERLAAIYTVLDHLQGEPQIMNTGYSYDNKIESEIGLYGDSEFLESIAGKDPEKVWLLMDELVEAVTVFNPRLMSNFMDKLNKL